MIEKTVYHYLGQSFPAFMEIPESFPDKPFVVIEKLPGGGKENHINSSRIAVQSYGNTLFEAAVLNERVKELMDQMVALDEVSKVSLNSDYNFTDAATKRYRYQAVFDIIHY